jgi:UDP-2,3-diacylglucosamine pyrophosphatase LpxH
LRKVLWIPDCHIPYEDKRAFELMLQAMRWWKPDDINILGDFEDFYPVSAHSKDPERIRFLKNEVDAINKRLDQLDALGAENKVFVEGNHADRLRRYLADKAPELFGLVSVRELFKLDSRGWQFTPYKQSSKQGKVYQTHECGNAGPHAHVKAMEAFQGNVVIGHTHRMAISYSGSARGKSHTAAMFGWLGDVEKVDYLHRIQALRAWQLGFGVGRQEANGTVHIQPVPIVDYKLVIDGRLFVG